MRTKKSLKNILSVVIFNVIIGIIGFAKVKVFVHYLSNDIYSLNQLFYQIFSYIVIADIGFGLVLNKQLYKAFANDDKKEIINIYSTSRKFYKYIGIVMLAASFIISFFVHYLTKADVPNNYIQLVCIIFLIRNILDYFFVAPRYIMDTNQNNYRINYLVKGIKIAEMIIEMLLVYLGVDYIFVLLPGIVITVVVDIYINRLVFKEYPWLKDNKTFNKKYLEGTKDLVYLKLSGIMNSNTDIILLSTFVNPFTVVVYTSYCYVTKFISDTIYVAATSITPSFANLLCKEIDEKIYSVCCELNILFLLIASFCFIMLYAFLNPLVHFWIGDEYLVGKFTLFLFCFIIFQAVSVRAVAITVNSLGLFKETKLATIFEAIINLIISIILVNKYKIIGVLLGTVIATLFTSFIQNAVLIYKKVFNKSFMHYFGTYFLIVLINIGFIFLFNIINMNITTIMLWILLVLGYALLVTVCLFGLYYLMFKSFRLLVKRAVEYIKVRGKYTE
jgi:O-antigen/teichoic acid export membrane protein